MENNEDDFSDVMIPYVEFAENANERTPCILVLDCSGSMRGEPIKQLNTGLQALEKELKDDIDASSRVQLLVIKAYGKDDADVSADWVDAMNFNAPVMEASGLSPIGKAMELALQKIEEQKCLYDSCGVTSKRPWIFLISDGEPTDYGWEQAAEKCRIAQEKKKVDTFLHETYPSLVKKAKQEDAMIFWGDETGINNQSYYIPENINFIILPITGAKIIKYTTTPLTAPKMQ